MKRKSWSFSLEGTTYHVELQHKLLSGSIYLNGEIIEQWKLAEPEDSHHLFYLKGHRCAVHIFYNRDGQVQYDLTIDEISVQTGNVYSYFWETARVSGRKVWMFELDSKPHQVILKHHFTGKLLIFFDDQLMEQSEIFDDSSHHFLLYKNHRIGVHVQKVDEFSYRYDLSINSRSLTTGDPVPPFLSSPTTMAGKKAWIVEFDGQVYMIRIEQSPIFKQVTVFLDEKKVVENSLGTRHSFVIQNQLFEVVIEEVAEDLVRYDLLINGISVETGNQVEMPSGGKDSWVIEAAGQTHSISIEQTLFKTRICLDGEIIHEQSVMTDEENSLLPFSLGEHLYAVWIRQKDFDYSFRLLKDGVCVDTGEKLLPIKANAGKRKWIWLFEKEGKLYTLEVIRDFWGRHSIYLNKKLIEKRFPWKSKVMIPLSADDVDCRLFIRLDWRDNTYIYDLAVNNQLLETGKPLDFSSQNEQIEKSLVKKLPFSQRIKETVGSFLFFGIFCYVTTEWIAVPLGWIAEKDWSDYIVVALVVSLQRMFDRFLSYVIFWLAIFLIFFAGVWIYDMWIMGSWPFLH